MRSPFGHKERKRILQRASKSCQSFLDLRGQDITSIPVEVFTKPLVVSLRILDLTCNGLESLPRQICLLASLEELYLGHNYLKSLPKELQDLPKLKKLSLVHNGFQEVPFCLSRLQTLHWLNLSGNLVEVVPPWLLCLSQLHHLYLVRNLIENIPREIYLHGIAQIRKYFGLKSTRELNSETNNVQQSLVSPTKTNFCSGKVWSISKSPDSNGCEMVSLSSKEAVETQILTVDPVFLPLVTPGDDYSMQHNCSVSGFLESQRSEISLIQEETRQILLKQKLRKQNIDYLRQIRNQNQTKQIAFPRKKIDFSLELEHLSRYRSRRLTTSEYGTCSSFTGSVEWFPFNRRDSCVSVQSEVDDAINNNTRDILELKNLSSDGTYSLLSNASEHDYEEDSCLEELPDRRRYISLGDICAIIPEENLTGHLQSEFTLEVLEDLSFHPKLGNRQVLASEVIQMQPHGAKFYHDDPAIINLPFDVKLGRNDHVSCLYSNTGVGQRPQWEEMNSDDFNVFATHVEIKAYHFSLFAIVVTKGYPEARRKIRAGIGGCLYVPEVPGVEVLFPESCLLHDIEASVKVLYADDPYDVDHSDPDAHALAAPAVQLGPHGCIFNPHSKDFVTVRLPLPDGKAIQESYGNSQLTFWCSPTMDGEDLHWQQFHPKFVHIDNDDDSLCSVYFSVEHFCFFRTLWDIVDTILWETKLGASFLIPIFQFNVSFQALMSEISDIDRRFGICVVCYRFGKPLEDIGNFPILVGKCIAPKMLSTGILQIRLESKHFKADTSIGMKELVARENFKGRPFVLQFGCQFIGEAPDHGTFGNVIVEQQTQYEGNTSVLSFLLNKPRSSEVDDASVDWEVQLTKELTALLSIKAEKDMGDEVWHEVAESLGYTPKEIHGFGTCDNPTAAIIADYKHRGGMPHQFISALYKTGSPGNMTRSTCRQRTSLPSRTVMEEERSEMAHELCPFDCVRKNARKRRLVESINWEEKFQDIAQKVVGNGKWKQLGRILRVGESKIQEIEHDCSIRQDGLQEKAYQVLIAWRDLNPDHWDLGNALGRLSNALCKIGLNAVARQYCFAAEMG